MSEDKKPAPVFGKVEAVTVKAADIGRFNLCCSSAGVICDGTEVAASHLQELLTAVVDYLSEKDINFENMDKVTEIDNAVGAASFELYTHAPVSPPEQGQPGPKPDDDVSAVRQPLMKSDKLSEILPAITAQIISGDQLVSILVQQIMMRAAVSDTPLIAITAVDGSSHVGGAVICNPLIPMTPETATVMYESMKNHAEEFRESCEKRNISINNLIIPSNSQINKLGKSGG